MRWIPLYPSTASLTISSPSTVSSGNLSIARTKRPKLVDLLSGSSRSARSSTRRSRSTSATALAAVGVGAAAAGLGAAGVPGGTCRFLPVNARSANSSLSSSVPNRFPTPPRKLGLFSALDASEFAADLALSRDGYSLKAPVTDNAPTSLSVPLKNIFHRSFLCLPCLTSRISNKSSGPATDSLVTCPATPGDTALATAGPGTSGSISVRLNPRMPSGVSSKTFSGSESSITRNGVSPNISSMNTDRPTP